MAGTYHTPYRRPDPRFYPFGCTALSLIAVFLVATIGGADGTDAPRSANSPTPTFWSFQPLVQSPQRHLPDGDMAVSAIDSFILEKLQEEKLTPNTRADRRTLIRRAYLDLLGMPPTYREVQEFVTNDDPTA